MDVTRCENGHFFDAGRFDKCPHCSLSGANPIANPAVNPIANPIANPAVKAVDEVKTVKEKEQPVPANLTLADAIKGVKPKPKVQGAPQAIVSSSNNSSNNNYSAAGPGPVVGWLVCTAGQHFGEDFRLRPGRNLVGRSSSMDVALTRDGSVARDKHAVVLYEPKDNLFLVQPGGARELFYLNGNVVLDAAEIKANDILSLGKTKLMFFPCCSETFSWGDIRPVEETQKRQ